MFDREQNELIERLIKSHGGPVVATFKEVPEEVIAWVCRDHDTIHYVYVKHDFRRRGIAKWLITGAKFYTHETKAGSRLFSGADMLFNPYKAGTP